MLRLVGHPVAVNPDAELRRGSPREEGWEVLRFDRLHRRLQARGRALGAAAAAGGGARRFEARGCREVQTPGGSRPPIEGEVKVSTLTQHGRARSYGGGGPLHGDRVVRASPMVVAGIIVPGILLVALEAKSVERDRERAHRRRALARDPFRGIFEPREHKRDGRRQLGLAALIYGAIADPIARFAAA